jgi:hypothetical protein
VSEASLLGDQRATLEDFFQVLYDRGVRISSSGQGAAVANAIADLLEALAVKIDRVDADETPFTPASNGQEQELAPQVLG